MQRDEQGWRSLNRDLSHYTSKTSNNQQQHTRRSKATLRDVITVIGLAFVCIAIGIWFLTMGGLL